MSTVAVVGATGTVGSRVAARLAERGHEVKAIARNPGTAPRGIEPVTADLADAEQAAAALEGATRVYLTPPLAGDDPLNTETTVVRNVIDAAANQEIEHVVMHTALRADRGDTGALILDNKTPLEEALADSGVGYTVLRPAWFLQNLWGARDYLEQGVVSMPWDGDMVWAASDVGDLVSAATALLEGDPLKRGLDLHIPGGITGNQIAEAASRVLGREVAYHQAQASSREYVEAFSISDVHKDLYAQLFDYFQATTYLGDPQPITEAVDGFEYRSVEDFLRDELFAGD